jgi:hypothetical protein
MALGLGLFQLLALGVGPVGWSDWMAALGIGGLLVPRLGVQWALTSGPASAAAAVQKVL